MINIKQAKKFCKDPICPLILYKYRIIDMLPYRDIVKMLKNDCGIQASLYAVRTRCKDLGF